MSDPKMLTAAAGLLRLQQAQAEMKFVQFTTLFSRVAVGGRANPTTGLVAPGELEFFSGSIGNIGAGFTRQLESSDISDIVQNGTISAGNNFIGFSLSVQLNPSMPDPIKRALAYRAIVQQNRNSTRYTFGRVQENPCGQIGVLAAAATTAIPNASFIPTTNGLAGSRVLPEDARIYVPALQQLKFVVQHNAPFYATTNGLPVGQDGAELIPRDGAVGEEAGYVDIILQGYLFQDPG